MTEEGFQKLEATTSECHELNSEQTLKGII